MNGVLDDMDSRPGSATSLLRTVVGLYLRDLGGWIAVRHLLALTDALGIPDPQSRTALSRVKKKGLLLPEARGDTPGYAVSASAASMLARGDRRIFGPRSMGPDDPWCVLSLSVPETERGKRHQLRRRLHWIGCGTVGQGLWICPDHLRAEVGEILADLDLWAGGTVFVTERPIVEGSLPRAVSRWWDLRKIASAHQAFLDECRVAAGTLAPGDAFAAYVRSIDTWRVIPYLDPGLPPDLLPADWPGKASADLFAEIRGRHEATSLEFVRATVVA